MYKMRKTDKRPLTYEEALLRAARLCSSSEHCRHEMEEKALSWGLSETDAARVADYLEKERYVDDARYSRAYANDKLRYNHWGRNKIRQMLRMQGIDGALAEEAVRQWDEEEYRAILQAVIENKRRTIPAQEDAYTLRVKLMRHALSRGFLMEEIVRLLPED